MAMQLHTIDEPVSEPRVSRAWLLCRTGQSRAASRGQRCVPARRFGVRLATLRSRRTRRVPRRGPRGGASVEGASTSRRDEPIGESRLE